ncbi:uncharacterized protein LOC112186838 isoform X2 [Rosa chinensis]|uniref:uncharacterized protein LOC112186838 isoform X2 n=1 Tax=Rosa chinensis TaxID=74649 RepID=UPI001AD8F1E8|nr:uncharacterized protein LOC112186838 isoform X2 [Rosa chinensis]
MAETEKEAIEGGLQCCDAQLEVEKADESEEELDQGDGDGDKNSSNDDTDYKPFFRAAKHWKWKIVMDFLKDHPEAIRKPAPSDDGKTVLHYAVDAVREDIVRRLLQYINTDDDLEIRDDQWCSALDYCYIVPEKDGTVEIAKCLLDKKKELLAGDVDPRVIRDLLVGAYIHGRSKLADYLYKVTPLKTDDPHVAHLISLSFSTKRFGIACDLIQKHPSLAIAKDNSDNSPLNELACTPSAFLSGSQLKFWEKLIYHVISIKPTPPVKSEEEPTLTMDNKGKLTPPLHAISIDVPTQEDGKGKPTPTPHAVPKDFPTHEDDRDKQSGLIPSVTALFQGLITENICKFFGIHRIYRMKLHHVRSLEILVCMCKVLTTKKMKNCDIKQKEFVETAIFQAAERGLVEFLTNIFRVNPDLATIKNEKGRNIFQVAVKCRQAKVYNLIHGFNKDTRKTLMGMTDNDDNNMLHMVGLFSPFAQTNCIRGAALQMQKELQWFKELESMASPEDLEAANDTHAMKPSEFFSKNHEELIKEAETSMKETATSCTVACALIVTMMFAAAFTVPGGNNEDDGIPKFLNKRAFRVFIVADALSLFTSTTSVMFFLGVLTSRYAEEDFLISLPRKMILGLLTLFLSVAAMMIAFTSALFLMLPTDSWIAFPTSLLTGIPIASFIWMQFPFLVEIFISTYIPRTFRKNVNEKLNLGRVRFRDAI